MNAPAVRPTELPEPSIQPIQGWHCTHIYYRFDRSILRQFSQSEVGRGIVEFADILNPRSTTAPTRLQTFIVSGHKADFGLMMLDPDPLRIDGVHQALQASVLGPALSAVYSFISLTEISEYVPSPEQYAQRLQSGGEDSNSPAFAAKVAAYEKRLPMMNQQRLTPELPNWPSTCFYPMNKSRVVGANWFTTPFAERNEMMAEHAQSGMAFAGRATQVITASIGFDDWEWGVTLWARNPQYLKEIVYKMRFDQASARFAEFGPFYIGYIADAPTILNHCRIIQGL